jgi:hypothetical protein
MKGAECFAPCSGFVGSSQAGLSPRHVRAREGYVAEAIRLPVRVAGSSSSSMCLLVNWHLLG